MLARGVALLTPAGLAGVTALEDVALDTTADLEEAVELALDSGVTGASLVGDRVSCRDGTGLAGVVGVAAVDFRVDVVGGPIEGLEDVLVLTDLAEGLVEEEADAEAARRA